MQATSAARWVLIWLRLVNFANRPIREFSPGFTRIPSGSLSKEPRKKLREQYSLNAPSTTMLCPSEVKQGTLHLSVSSRPHPSAILRKAWSSFFQVFVLHSGVPPCSQRPQPKL